MKVTNPIRPVVLLIIWLTFSTTAHAQIGLAQFNFPTGVGPVAVVTADFNRDGKPDLATANASSNTVSILLGMGGGKFGAHADLSTGANPVALVAADFNGDGLPDLAVVNSDDGTIYRFLGDGQGGFGPLASFSVNLSPASIVAGDFNGDGKMDLAVANSLSNNISILLGDGTGQFASKSDFATGFHPRRVISDDFNKDGKLDLAAANETDSTISVLLGHGDGTFASKADYRSAGSPIALISGAFSAAQQADIVTLSVFQGLALLTAKGNGTFDPAKDLGSDTLPIDLTAGDFDGDPLPDIANVTRSYAFTYYGLPYVIPPSLKVRRNRGNGAFADNFTTQLPADPAGVVRGDFNGDGHDDLAVVFPQTDTVAVFIQMGILNLSRNALDFAKVNQIVGVSSPPLDVSLQNLGTLAVNIGAIAITGADARDFSIVSENCAQRALTPDNNCTVSVSFLPASVGTKNATLSITDDALANPHLVPLAGKALMDFVAGPTPGTSTSQTMSAGQTVAFTLDLVPVNGFQSAVTLSCATTSLLACNVSPSSVQMNGSSTMTATVRVDRAAHAGQPLLLRWNPPVGLAPLLPIVLLAALCLLWFVPARRTSVRPRVALAGVLFALLLIASCGGGGPSPFSAQPGRYVVVVSVSGPTSVQHVQFVVNLQ